jgi:hypothetical protein
MEPERKIEKLLRAYAKKRRAEAGDPLKLHPANRRILLGEAASTMRSGTATEDGRRAPEPSEGSLFLLLLSVFRRRLVFVLPVIVIAFLAFMYLPALNSAKRKAQSIGAMSNLKQIGMAARQYAEDNKNVLPASLDEVTNELGTREVLIDPASRKPFVYAGGGKKLDGSQSNTLLAYSLADKKGHAVLFADGRVETVTGARFAELTNQKSGEFALAGQSMREKTLEIPLTAPPAASATPAPPPPSAKKTEIALAKDQSNAGDLGVNALSAGEPARRQPEIAESEPIKLEPVAAPAPIGAGTGSFGGVGQTTSVNGHISEQLAATENSDALAQNRSFARLTTQTNSVPPGFAASQNFVQAGVSSVQNLFKNSVASAQATPVLQSFQLQQNGDVILIVDRDGSVYHGSVQPETATVRNEPAPEEAIAARAAPPQSRTTAAQLAGNEQQAAQNYFFRVAGMNRTLKQNVVFTANLLANSGAPQTAQTSNYFGGAGGGGAGNQLQQVSANTSQQSLLSNSRIVGTALVASTNQIEINAVPVTQ